MSRSTLYSESIRARRICSTDESYSLTLERLETKARRSGFSAKVIAENRAVVESWSTDDRLRLLKPREESQVEKTEKRQIVWVSSLPGNVKDKFKDVATRLLDNVSLSVAYKRPPTLRSLIFRPRALESSDSTGYSKPCGHCQLCGTFRAKIWSPMVQFRSALSLKNAKVERAWKIQKTLDCKSNGIYVAICKAEGCGASYVGQTTTSFSMRWSGHRSSWRNDVGNSGIAPSDRDADKTALSDHYKRAHRSLLDQLVANSQTRGFDKAYEVVFVDSASAGQSLNSLEDNWRHKTRSQLNRCAIVTPNIV